MAFMENEVTAKQTWLEIDGTHGITFLPLDILSKEEFDLATLTGHDIIESELNEVFGKYYEGTVQEISLKIGYGARMSAPGYMDCTDWSVFDTEAEAQAYLNETYADDEDSEDEDSE